MTAVFSHVFFLNLRREIGARPAKIGPLAHALRLTAVFALSFHQPNTAAQCRGDRLMLSWADTLHLSRASNTLTAASFCSATARCRAVLPSLS